MDAETLAALDQQSKRHHTALSNIEGRYHSLDMKVDKVLAFLGGTLGSQGLAHTVHQTKEELSRLAKKLEDHETDDAEAARRKWWAERGTKMFDILIGALMIAMLTLALRAYILDVVKTGDVYQYVRPRLAQYSIYHHEPGEPL